MQPSVRYSAAEALPGKRPARFVDTRMDTAWTAVKPAWVMVDLESNKAFHRLIVRLAAGDAADVVLSLSADGTNFVSVKDAEVTERKIEAAIEGSWRYIRIEAKRAGTSIQAVHCMAKKGKVPELSPAGVCVSGT